MDARGLAARLAVGIAMVWMVGCGGEPGAAPTHRERAEPQREPPATHDSPSTEPSTPTTPAISPPEVDLLRAVPADLAVSSSYRDNPASPAHLLDELDSAWCSRTDDLVGAWIEVRLPPSATVTSIALTSGFARVVGDSDLFAGNHRLARVRVLRDGVELATHAVDPSSRELQRLAVDGPGGLYRIEVLEVVPGTRRDWREVCISTLQILGRDPAMRPGERFPRLAAGALPPERPAPGTIPRDELARAFQDELASLARAWPAYEEQLFQEHSGPDAFAEASARSQATRTRRTILTRLATLVHHVDEIGADGLRAAAYEVLPWADIGPLHEARRRDLESIAGALDRVAAALDEPARCRWARTHVRLRVHRLAEEVRNQRMWLEVLLSQAGENGGLAYIDSAMEAVAGAPAQEMSALERHLSRVEDRLGRGSALAQRWDRDARGTAALVRGVEVPESARAHADASVVRALLDAHASCWAAP
jgi:hypothetical protein